jgi:AcrR family transcriptional regulator
MRAMSAAPFSAIHATHRLHADERRLEVIEAAVQAFAIGGLAGTSTEDIARIAGVSQPYVFRLFGSKQALFLAAVGRAFERIRLAFEEAARHPVELEVGYNATLASMGLAYEALLQDRALLRLQLHAFAACSDPVVSEYVRAEFAALVARVAELSGVTEDLLRTWFAEGMLLNVAAAMNLTDSHVAWQRICEGGVRPA